MSFTFDMAGIAAILALVLSLYATYKTISFNNMQKKLIESQERLNLLLLDREASESQKEKKADLDASLIKVGNGQRLRVYNKGKCSASNVSIEFEDGDDFIMGYDNKFPMSLMHPQQSVDLTAFVHISSKSKFCIKLLWEDAHSDKNTKEIHLTC